MPIAVPDRLEFPLLYIYDQGPWNACVPCALAAYINTWKWMLQGRGRVSPVTGELYHRPSLQKKAAPLRPYSAAYLYVWASQPLPRSSLSLSSVTRITNALTDPRHVFALWKHKIGTYADVYDFDQLSQQQPPPVDLARRDRAVAFPVTLETFHPQSPYDLQRTIQQRYGALLGIRSPKYSFRHYVYVTGYTVSPETLELSLLVQDSDPPARYSISWNTLQDKDPVWFVFRDRFL